MRQIVIPRHGSPDVFELRETVDPDPAPGDVRVRVRASGVNFADILARMGLYPDAPKPPVVVGYEVAGRVDALGSGVTKFREGDRVLALTRFGGYADVAVAPADFVFPIPSDLSDADAAAIPVNYLTAVLALYKMANLTAGETALIHGAAGGVGIAATQLARLRRAKIVGTASAAKHDALRSFGVDYPIDYRTANVEEEVRRITNGRGLDVILDPIGGASYVSSYRMLAPLGRLVMYGVSGIAAGEQRNWWQMMRFMWRMPRFKPLSMINRNRGIFGLNLGHLWTERHLLGPTMEMLLAEVEARRLRPVLSKIFPLERAADAHRFIQARGNIGKVVLTT